MSELIYRGARMSPALARSIPFAIYIAFLAIAPWLQNYLPDHRWLYAIKIAMVTIALGVLAPYFEELRHSWRTAGNDLLLAVPVGIATFVLWINLDLPWASVGSEAGFDPRDAHEKIDVPLAVIRIAGASLIVPVMEELFWRSFIMRWCDKAAFISLAPQAVTWRALIISSVLFGIEHNLWLAGMLAGLAYGFLYMRSGNIWSPIVAHATTNLLLGCWVLYSGNWQFW